MESSFDVTLIMRFLLNLFQIIFAEAMSKGEVSK